MSKTINKIIKKIIFYASKIFWTFPIDEKKIYLLNFDGTLIGHDAKAIVEWGTDNEKKYKYVWGVKDVAKIETTIDGVTFVKINSFRGVFEILTAKAIVYNINPPSYFSYRPSQKLINTWHGFIGKKIGKYIHGYNKYQFNLATCFMSESSTNTKNIREAFEYDGLILETGAPRNDVFFSKSYYEKRSKVRNKYEVGVKKIALFAPTFRGDFKQKLSELDFSMLSSALENRFGGEWVIFVRTHPMITERKTYEGNEVIDVSTYEDTQEILCAADIAITDFSSIFYDFSLTGKPVFLYFEDISLYEKDRGFLFSVYDLPFSIAESNDELKQNITKFDQCEYTTKLKDFYSRVGNFNCGQACKSLFKYIESD